MFSVPGSRICSTLLNLLTYEILLFICAKFYYYYIILLCFTGSLLVGVQTLQELNICLTKQSRLCRLFSGKRV